jgi:hypothetical protein
MDKGKAVSSDYTTGSGSIVDSTVSGMAQANSGGNGIVNRLIVSSSPSTSQDSDPSKLANTSLRSFLTRILIGYKVHFSFEFKFGVVFKVLWSEPTGSTGTELSEDESPRTKYKAFNKVRRFVVVDDRNSGHSICLPILTYGGQGTRKRGVHAYDHAIVFTSKEPVKARGEKITKRSIRVIPSSPREKLDPMSRINYSKVYTVEHNVKICIVGQVSGKYEQQLTTDYNNTHRPLPDRPHPPDITDDDFGHEEGSNRGYFQSLMPNTADYSSSTSTYSPAQSAWSPPTYAVTSPVYNNSTSTAYPVTSMLSQTSSPNAASYPAPSSSQEHEAASSASVTAGFRDLRINEEGGYVKIDYI